MFAEIKIDGIWQKVGKEFVSTYPELSDGTDRVYDKYDKELMRWLTYNIEPQGIPLDASAEIKEHKYFNDKQIYWLTLEELLSLEIWDTEIFEGIGFISEWQYKQLKEKGSVPIHIRPKVHGINAITVMPFEMDMIMRYPKLRATSSYYIQYNYDQTAVRNKFDFFCNTSIPRLIELIPDGGTAKDVRIIFGY